MYGTTEKKITHIIKDNHDNGLCGFWITICGKWIHPQSVTDERPEEGRMCKPVSYTHLTLPTKRIV